MTGQTSPDTGQPATAAVGQTKDDMGTRSAAVPSASGADELTGSPAGSLLKSGSAQGGSASGEDDPQADGIDAEQKRVLSDPAEGKR